MLQQDAVCALLQEARNSGADFAEVYQEVRNSCSILYENGAVDKVAVGGDAGMGIRLRKNGRMMYTHTNTMTEEAGRRLIRECLLEKDPVMEVTEADAGNEAYSASPVAMKQVEKASVRTAMADVEKDPEQVSLEDKTALLILADQTARAFDPAIRQVSISYKDTTQSICIASTEVDPTEEKRITVRMSCQVIAGEGNHLETGYASLGGCCGMELLSEENIRKMARNAAGQAITLLHADPCPGGVMPVVLSSEAGGTMVHEACGHGLEGDLVLRDMSVYAGKIGEKVASEKVTVYDDGSLAGGYGSYAFDDEGNVSRRNILIDHGILKQYLCDSDTAKKLGVSPTGNGRRESYRHEPVTRMSNTFIASGTDDVDAILRSVDYGLFVKHMGGGQVDTLTGNYVFDVSEGYLIEHGVLTRPVRGATLIGNGPESLMQIEMVGNDMGTAIGTCGKFGQGVPVGDGQPTILIRGLTVGGTVKEN